MSKEKSTIASFYTAFQNKDAKTMVALYHDSASFEDPAFGKLSTAQVKSMWAMLIERGGKDLKITFEVINETKDTGEAIWQAQYVFSKTKRPVHNIIHAKFKLQGGKIIDHQDQFDFWKWSRMALGVSGILLGWTPLLKNKVRAQSLKLLAKYMRTNQN